MAESGNRELTDATKRLADQRLVVRANPLQRDTPADREKLVSEDVARSIKVSDARLVEAFAARLTTLGGSEREEDHIGFGVVAELHADLVRR